MNLSDEELCHRLLDDYGVPRQHGPDEKPMKVSGRIANLKQLLSFPPENNMELHQFVSSFNAIAAHINAWADRKGWNEDDPMNGSEPKYKTNEVFLSALVAHDISKLGLMVTEIAEAIEGRRHGDPPSDKIPDYSSQEEELADCIVRIMHYAAQRKLRVAEALLAKLDYNETRPYKHGKQA